MGGHPKHPSKSDLSLEQAVEVAMGILPREVNTLEELPKQWRHVMGVEDGTSPQLTLFAGVSPVNPIPLRGNASASPTRDGSGPNSSVLFAYYDPASSLWKMYQVSLFGGAEWTTYSEGWPPSGTVANGKAYRRPPLVPRTFVTGSSLWPTVRATEWKGNLRQSKDGYNWPTLTGSVMGRMWPSPLPSDVMGGRTTKGRNRQNETGLRRVAQMATPQSRDFRTGQAARWANHRRSRNLNDQAGGKLSVIFVEWLMGFPLGWTDLKDSEMPLSRKSRSGSAKGLSRR